MIKDKSLLQLFIKSTALNVVNKPGSGNNISQRSANYCQSAKASQPSVSVNKVLLVHSHARSFTCGHGYFCTERAEMSSCDRDSVPQRSLKSLLSVSFQKKIIDPWIRELRVEKSELKLRKWVRFPGKKGRLGA